MGRTEEGKAVVLWVSVASKPPSSVGHIYIKKVVAISTFGFFV